MPRILLENDVTAFKPDRTAIKESKDPLTGLNSKRIPGTLSVCDCINGNRRRYRKAVWEKNLSEGSPLRASIARRSTFGLLEHPADGKVDLRSPISHLTVDAALTEGVDDKGAKVWFVKGVIEVLGTADGLKLSSLIEAGYDPNVSSRGYGSLTTAADGVDDVEDDFVCEGWDVVSLPSFAQATLRPQRAKAGSLTAESVAGSDGRSGQPGVIGVQMPPQVETLKISAPSSANMSEAQKTITMDITKIKESIASLRAISPASLDARSFAAGFQRMAELHNAAAKHLSENATASWDVEQLHKELTAVEETWTTAFNQPRVEVKKLTENQVKLLTVVKKLTSVVADRAKILGECRGKLTKANEIAVEVAKRGRAWMETAKRDHSASKLFERKYSFCTEALDIMAERYKGDVAELGVRVLELEFPTMTAEQKKALSEAKTPKAVLVVRESIEKPAKKKVLTEAEKAVAAVAVKGDKKDDKKDAPVIPARPLTEGVEILKTDVTHSVLESAGMARRLSQSRAL